MFSREAERSVVSSVFSREAERSVFFLVALCVHGDPQRHPNAPLRFAAKHAEAKRADVQHAERAVPDEIFNRIRLTPGQLRIVAARRLEDARYLLAVGHNRHTNGAMYLAGFTLECLLKAMLLEKHPEARHDLDPQDRRTKRIRSLLFSHDLVAIAAELPDLSDRLVKVDPPGGLRDRFENLCQRWNIFARYSPSMATIAEALTFVSQIKELAPWLR